MNENGSLLVPRFIDNYSSIFDSPGPSPQTQISLPTPGFTVVPECRKWDRIDFNIIQASGFQSIFFFNAIKPFL